MRGGPSMRNALFAALALLAACATTSNVVPAGQDLHTITGDNQTCGNCESPELRATKRASEYCAQSGKVLDTARQTFDLGIGNHYTLTFACVDKR